MTGAADIAEDLDAAPASASERRCIATGAVRPKDALVRFVVRPGPDGAGELVPDLEERLPGRGLWITARHDIVAAAVAKRSFAKAARMAVSVPPDLAERLAALLARRCVDLLGLARRANQAVAGFEQVRARTEQGRTAVLVEAADGSAEGRRKLLALAGDVPVIVVLSGHELGAVFGRDWIGHVALGPGGIAEKFRREANRLAGFRSAVGNSSERRLTTDG